MIKTFTALTLLFLISCKDKRKPFIQTDSNIIAETTYSQLRTPNDTIKEAVIVSIFPGVNVDTFITKVVDSLNAANRKIKSNK